jgi:hypothetical protein
VHMHTLQLKLKESCFSFLLNKILNIKSTCICNFFTYLNEEALYFLFEHTKMLELDINIYNNHMFIKFLDGNIKYVLIS